LHHKSQNMPAMTFLCTPSQAPRSVGGAATGTKRRRRSRRGEQLCAGEQFDPALVSLKLDAVGEPLRRRSRLGQHPPCLQSLQAPHSTPNILKPLIAEAEAALAAVAEEAACKAEEVKAAEEAARIAEEAKAAEEAACKAEEARLLQNLKTIVISMERRPDRWQGCAARLTETCPGLPFQLFPAVDGRQTPIGTNLVTSSWDSTENVVYQRIRSERKGWDDLHTYHERVLELSPGERGCAASHIGAWRHCLAIDAPLLVLEDDAAPMPDFAGILRRAMAALPAERHVLYLGYSQAAGWRREISAELVESEYVWTTVGYILWPSAARLLLSKLPIDQPVDNWMANLCAKGELKAFCIRPKIIRQSDAWNCGSDIMHSDENYWGPDSDIIHSEVAPVETSTSLGRAIPGAIFDDGSSFWDLSGAQQEQVC